MEKKMPKNIGVTNEMTNITPIDQKDITQSILKVLGKVSSTL